MMNVLSIPLITAFTRITPTAIRIDRVASSKGLATAPLAGERRDFRKAGAFRVSPPTDI